MAACLAAGIALGSLQGCGDSPDAEVEAARTAIEAAKQAGAAEFAPAGLLEATQYLDSARSEIEAQKKGWFGHDFADARRLLRMAGDKARAAGAAAQQASIAKAAQAQAAAAKDSGRADSLAGSSAPAATREKAQSSINLAYAGYQNARRHAGANAKTALDAILQSLKDARTALKAKDYAKAIGLAQAASAKLDSLPK